MMKKLEKENIFFCWGEEKRKKKMREIFGKGEFIFAEERKNGEGKEGNSMGRKMLP